MSQIIQNLNAPLVPGEEYQLTFNADITSGILIVKQGTTIIYQSDHLFLGEVGTFSDTVNIIDYVYLDRSSRVFIEENLSINENIKMETVCNINIYDSVNTSESFS